jgi:hypothetical protein
VATPLLSLLGVWRVTTPPPARPATVARGEWLRRLARYVTAVGYVVICATGLWEDASAVAYIVYDDVAAALLWAYLALVATRARLSGHAVAAWVMVAAVLATRGVFAANVNRGFNETVFWVALGVYAVGGVTATTFLLALRRALLRRLLVP